MSTITGTSGADKLTGTAGNDIIDGLQDKDAMYGGKGNDIYFVDLDVDQVFENKDEGTDLVKSTVTYTLPDYVENLTLLGSGNIAGIGNEGNNVLTGNDGNNVLIGNGGKDTLIGGKGDDTYVITGSDDKVVESIANANGGGTDKVVTSHDFSIAALGNIENLELAAGAIKGTGNALDNTITGEDVNNIIDGGKGADTMIGGKGHDTYYIDNAGDVVKENSGEGTDTVISTIALANGPIANVENYRFETGAAIKFSGNGLDNYIYGGSGNDTIDGGGTGDDRLFGRAGNDTLVGGAGQDSMDGGTGADIMKGFGSDDFYYVDSIKDQVIEQKDEGHDTLVTKVALAVLADNVEDLILDGTAGLAATGNALDNYIWGNSGANLIDGGAGKDTMEGGFGSDTYIVDNVGDKVVESAGGAKGGIDLVKSAVSFTLAANIENLVLTGTADNFGFGNELKNVITGNSGKNLLDGQGGDDTMTGGAGDDTYIVDSKGDKVVEGANGGTDWVYSAVDFSLASLGNVEHLSLTGAAAIHAIGNAKDNQIYGNGRDNDIDGGAGADSMHGGAGNDVYHIDNVLDYVEELSGEGNDTVFSKVALDLGAANIENYVFQTSAAVNFTINIDGGSVSGGSGADILNGSTVGGSHLLQGNAGNDTLYGGAKADLLDGGQGADQMSGGDGNDLYIVDNAKDLVTEKSGWGIDEVQSSVSILHLFDNVEDLHLTGSGNINGSGNELANTIIGNSGKNALSGQDGDDTLYGGYGDDTLTGGAGKDTFQFFLGQTGEGRDKVTDFVKAEDVLWFGGVSDHNKDGTVDLLDLFAEVKGIVDHGAGQAVDVTFNNGASISLIGCGTGAVDTLSDLVSNPATQIHIN